VLDDYAFTVLACLDAYEASGDLRYFARAGEIAARMISGFYDETGGGFFDLDSASLTDSVGALSARRKPFQDSPTPAGDSAAALALLRLHALSGETRLQELAQDTLEVFAGVAGQFGVSAGTYALASVWMACAHTLVVVIGEGAEADGLYAEALAPFALNKIVLRVKDAASLQATLPPELAETISAVPGLQQGRALAMLCSGFACQPPIHTAGELREALRSAMTQGG
jgi:uncharacterized protein YyaL (SSP411 family)